MRSLTSWTLLIAVSIAVPASATTIVLDPGGVGTSFRQQSFPLDGLIGVPFDGRGLNFNFVFGDMKHLELAFNNDDPTRSHRYAVELLLRHDLGATPPRASFRHGFLERRDRCESPVACVSHNPSQRGDSYVLSELHRAFGRRCDPPRHSLRSDVAGRRRPGDGSVARAADHVAGGGNSCRRLGPGARALHLLPHHHRRPRAPRPPEADAPISAAE